MSTQPGSTVLRSILLPLLVAAVAVSTTLDATPSRAQEFDTASINASYKDPDIQVDLWSSRLEREGREAFDFRNEITAWVGLRAGQSVADIGAGTGLFTPLLAREVGPEGRVYAVDIVPKFIEHIRTRAADSGLDQVSAVLSTDTSTNLEPNSVDAVFICDTYHHFEDPEAMLGSIRRALRPGGKLVLVEFDRVEGVSSSFVLQHIRADKETFTDEVTSNGFRYLGEVVIPGMKETFMRHFARE